MVEKVFLWPVYYWLCPAVIRQCGPWRGYVANACIVSLISFLYVLYQDYKRVDYFGSARSREEAIAFIRKWFPSYLVRHLEFTTMVFMTWQCIPAIPILSLRQKGDWCTKQSEFVEIALLAFGAGVYWTVISVYGINPIWQWLVSGAHELRQLLF